MSKDEFQNMDKMEKAEYINNNLREGMSFKDIYEATLNNNELVKSKEALLNQFKKAGYRINEKHQNNHVFDDTTPPEAQSLINNSSVNMVANDKLQILLDQSNDIRQMLEWWKNSQSHHPQENRLTQDIPHDGDDIRKTIRINNMVWEKWKMFCSQHPGYSEKDLFAKALLFYIDE